MIREIDDGATILCGGCGAPARPAMTRCRVCARPLRERPANGDGASALPVPSLQRPARDALELSAMLELADDYVPDAAERNASAPLSTSHSPADRVSDPVLTSANGNDGGESLTRTGEPLMPSYQSSASGRSPERLVPSTETIAP